MFKFTLITVLTVLLLTGCGGDEQVFSEQYYRENEQAKLEKIAYCNENPDEKLISLNCINALSVSSQEKMELQRGKGIEVNLDQADVKPSQVDEKHSKQYYIDNDTDRTKQVSICNSFDDVKKWSTPNCGTALAAAAYVKTLNKK